LIIRRYGAHVYNRVSLTILYDHIVTVQYIGAGNGNQYAMNPDTHAAVSVPLALKLVFSVRVVNRFQVAVVWGV
jgi:hypothetical protein